MKQTPIVAIQRRSFANGHRPLNFISRTFAGALRPIGSLATAGLKLMFVVSTISRLDQS